jgi:hypothetical protein
MAERVRDRHRSPECMEAEIGVAPEAVCHAVDIAVGVVVGGDRRSVRGCRRKSSERRFLAAR